MTTAVRSPQEMTTVELLSWLRGLGVHLWIEDDLLRFQAPKGVLSADLRAQMAARKGEILEFLRQAAGAVRTAIVPAIERAPRDRPLALSFAQQRLWFLQGLAPRSSAYNVPFVMRVEGALDVAALGRAFGEIVRRHEVLRTTIHETFGAPRQVIGAHVPRVLPVVDLGRLAEPVRTAEAHRLATTEVRRPFDLACGPVYRTALLRLEATRYVVVATFHHVAADGWSVGVVVRELSALYVAFAAGRPSPLPEPRLQYADFAVWQRAWLAGEVLALQIDYWKTSLAGAPAVAELPADRPRPPVQSFRGHRLAAHVPAAIADRLEALARAEQASPFMVLLAVFYLLLARSTGREDAVVGTPIANRNREEIEGLIGFFVNTLALRLTGLAGLSGRALVRKVRDVTLGAYAHQDLPFEKLVEELDPERDLSRHPIFQTMFALQNAPSGALEIPGLSFRLVGVEDATAKFDWNLSLWQSPQGLGGWLEVASDLFDRTTALRAVRHYRVLAAALADAPERPVLELSMLEPSERHQLLAEHGPAGDPGELPTVVALFERQLERSPDAIAMVAGEAALSYRELAARAHHLAHALRARGVGPEVAVGISCQRSLEMGIAVLGVLAAGGAYVPLDPAYPQGRLDFMVENSRAPLVLTAESLRALDGRSEIAPAATAVAANLLYVIYTSGSTGRPKGVSLPHAALSNLILWHRETLLGAARTLQFASLSFDASFHEMFAAWTSGGTLLMITEELRHDPEALGRFLAAERVEKVILPVVLLQRLAELFPSRAELPLSLREITATGEQLHVTPPVARFVADLPGCSFHNHYGPSETHVVTAHTLAGPAERWPSHPPIGRPLPFCPCHVLDRWGEIAALGVAGELFLGGVQLARGYLHRPALTAEKFVPHPLAGALGEPGARLYRTGDLARTLTDGSLEYLGRIDHQVKIRGYRVELGEVEGALGRHPELRQAVVVADRDRAGYYRLVAYVVPEPGSAPSAEALRDFLRAGLPDFMLPAAFVLLDELPLSANQKVDRKRLPAPEESAVESAGEPPRTAAERALAAIWCQVLGRERVTVTDSFFLLGGHSLLATQVSSRVRQELGVELPVRALFETPTLEGLARQLERAQAAGRPVAPKVSPAPRGAQIPLSFGQERLWFLHQLEPASHAYHLPIALRFVGRLEIGALAGALAALVERHEALRTVFAVADGRPVQHVLPAAVVALPVIDLTALDVPVAVARRLATAAARRPFDLARGPLLRALLLRLGTEDHVGLWTLHHIVSDDWSSAVVVRELGALYRAAVRGERSPLRPLGLQYPDYAVWQRGWLQGEVLAAEIAHWRRRLSPEPPALELPADRPRPPVASGRGRIHGFGFDTAETAALRALALRSGATLYMVLGAVFAALLARLSGQRDFALGTPIAGRSRVELEGLVGFFVNTLVLRFDLGGAPSLRELLARTRELALDAQAHQEVPFEKLVEELRPERSLARSPLFQVAFALQNAPRAALELPGLELRPFQGGEAGAKFDLSLNLSDADPLFGVLEWNTDLFDRTTIRRLAAQFRRLARAFPSSLDTRVGELELLAPTERHQLLLEWNDTRLPPTGAFLHERLAEHARRHPEALAVVGTAGEPWSYAELDRRCDELARYLRRRGVGPEVRVGVALERSPEWVAAFLAVLRAGGVYVPLDPTYPAERLRFMLEDAEPALVIDRRLIDTFALDTEEPVGDLPAPARLADANAAYMIYTSGSTGRPKGVLLCHRGLANLVAGQTVGFEVGPEDRVLQFASANFDASVWDVAMAVSAGAALVLTPAEALLSPPALARWIAERGVTLTLLPPSLLALLDPAAVPLRVLLAGGEACPEEQVRRWAPGRLMVNAYGPTEVTVCSTLAVLDPGGSGAPPIGRPVGGLHLAVLDREGRPSALGVPGELVVGGAGVGRGYHRRAGLTAERFIPDPQGEPGGRCYRTGDLVRWHRDGKVLYLGRIDTQVKLRGFRIELGEIEAALLAEPEIVAAAAVLARDPRAEARLIACVVARATVDPAELRRRLGGLLPPHMVPAAVLVLDALPQTLNRKLDRRALTRVVEQGLAASAGAPASAAVRADAAVPSGELQTRIAQVWCQVLEREQVGAHDNFFDLGGHSLMLARLQVELEQALGREVKIVDLFRFPTVAAFAEHFQPGGGAEMAAPVVRARSHRETALDTRVAIVGIALRFPGAASTDELWRNLAEGRESIVHWSEEELLAAGISRQMLDHPSFVGAGAPIDGIELFDAGLFGISPREAEITDPQQRLFLECAWEALERAGCDPESFGAPIGVFAGVAANHYLFQLLANPQVVASAGSFQLVLSNDKDFLATRASYKLDLKGPSVNVQTACSTALVATHLACRSLIAGECELALAGGVSASPRQVGGYVYEPDAIVSPDGHCRAFDARGQGTVAGSGVAVVALKRLEDALRDGDHVHAVILGTAINNDGAEKVGFSAPSVGGQAQAIAEAQAAAGVRPDQIGLIEAHGTATPLGDLIEVTALHEVFGRGSGHRCALGSIKTNMGHLDAAAGVAGLIKAALAVEHGQVPPSLHFERPNPRLELEGGPFFVPTELAGWPQDGVRRAGVSSFGLGGTNAHAVLEQPPAPAPAEPARPWQAVVLSAATPSALEAATDRLAAHLAAHPELALADVAYTTQLGRRRLPHRRAVVATATADAARALAERDPRRLLDLTEEQRARPVAFLLPGLGDQSPFMTQELYTGEPVFRAVVDRCAELLAPRLGLDLRQVLYPEGVAAPARGGGDLRRLLGKTAAPSPAEALLEKTSLAQPAVFVIEVALARLLGEWGIAPAALLGYSLGEYAAAHLAGVLELEDALALVAERARLIETLPEGAMLAVSLAATEVLPLLGEELSLAAVNAPQVSVVAGPTPAVAALATELDRRGVVHQRLRTRHAFHSTMMAPIVERFAALLSGVALRPPRIPLLSNVTGTWMSAEQATDPRYWVRHLVQTVRFSDGVGELLRRSEQVLLEIGPGRALATSVRQHPARRDEHAVVSSLGDARESESDAELLTGALARLWLHGVRVDWRGHHRPARRLKVALPTYPFERKRFWVEPQAPAAAAAGAAARKRGQRTADLADWFFVPVWRPVPAPAPGPLEPGPWLVLADELGVGAALAAAVERAGRPVVVVRAGSDLAELERRAAELCPRTIVHLWHLGAGGGHEGFDALQRSGLGVVLALVRTLAAAAPGADLRLAVVADGLHGADDDALEPAKSTLPGALKVLPQELGNLSCQAIEITAPRTARETARLAERLLAELVAAGTPERAVALGTAGRGAAGRRVLRYEPVRLEAPAGAHPGLRERGVYLLTGGFGKAGSIIARYLAATVNARLVLVGRTALESSEPRRQLVAELESAGAEVLAAAVDVTDRAALASVLAAAVERFGALDGIFHLAGTLAPEHVFVPFERTDAAVIGRHFGPKVVGLYHLAEVVEALPESVELDFCVVFSSMSSVLGGLGFTAYAAANSFVDAFARHQNRRGRVPWMSLDWDGWRAAHEAPSELSMAPEESAGALHRALALLGTPQLVVSVADLETRLDRWVRLAAAAEKPAESMPEGAPGAAAADHDRPALATPYVAPRDAHEQALAEVWQELLGIGRVGVHDHFFELGGDSLLATRMLSRVRQQQRVQLALADFFAAPTVAGLVAAARGRAAQPASELEALLGAIEDLPEEEVAARLSDLAGDLA